MNLDGKRNEDEGFHLVNEGRDKARFDGSWNYSFLVKVLLVKLKGFSLNYDKIVTKNIRDVKIVGFIKIFEQYPHEFKVLSFFQLSSKTVRGFESEI